MTGSKHCVGDVCGAWTRRDWLITAALFAGTFLSRLPFRTTLLYAWDSVLYARALDGFNVSGGVPQPPGHIFYVGLLWLLNSLLKDPNSAMIWISVFFAAAAVAALYWLGRRMFGTAVGFLAALLLATSTSFWAYSEMAYPYTLLGFLSIIVAGAVYRLWEGNAAWALPSALLLGAASGFREDLLFFLLPLLLIALWSRRRKFVPATAAILGAWVAAWYVPSALLSGGFGPYRRASSFQTTYLLEYFSIFGRGFSGVGVNSTTLAKFLLIGLAAAAPLLALFLFVLFLPSMREMLRDRRLWFLAVWSAPSLLFYIFIHVGDYGYVFTFLPAALLACAWGLWSLVRSFSRTKAGRQAPRVFALAAAAPVALNLVLFLVIPTPLSAGRIAARDDILSCRLNAIRGNFDPATTFIVSVFDYQHALYYLPGYTSWHFDPAVETHPSRELPPGIKSVVIFEEYLKPRDAGTANSLEICADQQLFFMDPRQERRISVDWEKRQVGFDAP